MTGSSLSIRRITDQTIGLVSEHFLALFAIALIGAAPGLAMAVPSPATSAASGFDDLAPMVGYMAFTGFIAVVSVLLWLLVSSALFFVADDAANGVRPTLASAFARARRVYGRALGATLLAALVLGGALMGASLVGGVALVFVLVPGWDVFATIAFVTLFVGAGVIAVVFISAPLTMVLPGLILFERRPVVDSISRSFELVRGRRIRVGLLCLLAYAVLSAPGMALATGIDAYTASVDPGFPLRLLFELIAVLVAAVITPFFIGAVYFTYRAVAAPAPEPALATSMNA